MATFANTISPTPFAFFDSDTTFQSDADGMVTFVKRKLGDDVLSVELTNKQIWACFEESVCEYSRLVHEMRIKSELVNLLGLPTSSVITNTYPRKSLEYLMRQAEPYVGAAFVGGSFNATLGYFDLVVDRQEYDIYTELKDVVSGTVIYNTLPTGSRGKLKIVDVFHFEPFAAQSFLLNASNVTNFLATNFNYESYVHSSVFYVLPVFEDVLRRSMLEYAFRVRRSNYSYEIIGSKLKIYPLPTVNRFMSGAKLYVKVMKPQSVLSPAYTDDSINGISGPNNVPFGNLTYSTITQPGRQWIRQYTLALAKELLGLVRSKYNTIPIPNAEVTLNGEALITQARDDKEKLVTQMKEFLDNLTDEKLTEVSAKTAENINKQLKYIPMPRGKAIIIG